MADAKNTRRLPAVPVVDRVPLIVCWALIARNTVPAEAGPTTERLLNVFVPLIEREPLAVDVKLTL